MANNTEAGWQAALKWVNDIAALAERLVAAEVRARIDAAWPRYTGFSAANNRVELGFAHDFPLDPAIKVNREGSALDAADAALIRDLRTLQGHVTPGIISIGNPADYAADVGWIEGQGESIYQEAGVSGAAAGVRRVYLEWQRYAPTPR